MHLRHLVPGALITLVAGPLSAQTITPLVRQGDSVTGVGLVTGIQRVAINDNGDWLVEVDTDNVSTSLDEVIIKNNALYQQQGVVITEPAGATLVEFNGMSLRNGGDGIFNYTLSGTTGGTTDNAGLYFNQHLSVQKGATPLDTGWNAGSTYSSFSWAKLNAANQMCVRGIVVDPVSTPTQDWYISLFQLDPAGNALTESVVARAGVPPPGQVNGVLTIRSSQDSNGFNNLGHFTYGASLMSPEPTATNATVYLWNGTANVLLAQKGLPSPVAGYLWGDLLAPELALNDAGDWLIKDPLDGLAAANEIIIKNGAKFIQEGDTLAAIGGTFLFTTFGNAPVSLSEAGEVCWYGDWSDPVTTLDTGIFIDQALVVQEGVTQTTGGLTFNALLTAGTSATAGQNSLLYISPNGRYVIFSGRTSNNVFGAFLLDRGLPITSFCAGDGTGTACPCGNVGASGNGCASSVQPAGASLTTTGTGSVAAGDLVLHGGSMPNSSCLFFQGTTELAGGDGVPFGDGLRCVGGTIVRLSIKTVVGGLAQYPEAGDPTIAVKGMIPLAGGVSRSYQCWYRNAAVFCTTATFNLTNGITVPWAP